MVLAVNLVGKCFHLRFRTMGGEEGMGELEYPGKTPDTLRTIITQCPETRCEP